MCIRDRMSTVHKTPEHAILQYTKGAPDEVLKRCTSMWDGSREIPLTDSLRQEILSENKHMADQALRVLCGAMRVWDSSCLLNTSRCV